MSYATRPICPSAYIWGTHLWCCHGGRNCSSQQLMWFLGAQDKVVAQQRHRRQNIDKHLTQMCEEGEHNNGEKVGGTCHEEPSEDDDLPGAGLRSILPRQHNMHASPLWWEDVDPHPLQTQLVGDARWGM